MNNYHAAKHYASALRNFLSEIDCEDAVSVYSSDELSGRYGDVPKVIAEIGGMQLLGTYEVSTDFGFVDLRDYGLDESKMSGFIGEPYTYSVICFYDA